MCMQFMAWELGGTVKQSLQTPQNHTRMHARTHARTYARTYARTHGHTHTHTHTHARTHARTHAHTHTHTHTHRHCSQFLIRPTLQQIQSDRIRRMELSINAPVSRQTGPSFLSTHIRCQHSRHLTLQQYRQRGILSRTTNVYGRPTSFIFDL